jgi:hypothetical protein
MSNPRSLFTPFLIILLCATFAPGPAEADNKAPAPEEYNATFFWALHASDSIEDRAGFFLDQQYAQWVRRENRDQEAIQNHCSPPGKISIPDWAEPLPRPRDEIICQTVYQTAGLSTYPPLAQIQALAFPEGVLALITINHKNFKLWFSGPRWIAPGDVRKIVFTDRGRLLITTDAANTLIGGELMTLEEKALHFEKIAQARHNRDGMISDCTLTTPGDVSSYKLRDDDNDGQWSEMYLAAESFRWAVTQDPAAHANAQHTFRAMIKLLTIAPVKGFPARSVLPAHQCPGADPQNWRMLPGGAECWKSDTSVDELVGHYFGLPIYYDLVADDQEKETIRRAIADLTDYILDNGLRLVDENGQVTTHGNWDPEWVNTVGRTGDQGLNSAQALNALLSAHHITGNNRYLNKYHELIKEHGYHKNALKWKEIGDRFQVNHDSDEMGFLSFYNLLRYEDDDAIRKYYIEGLRRAWETDLPERNPEQIIIYGAFAKENFRLDLAVRTLREIPLDLIKWSVHNSIRTDLPRDPDPDRFVKAQSAFVPPYTETRTMRWSENMYLLDVDDGGRSEAMPVFWLLPYWMARYHGMIQQPQNPDSKSKD